MNPVGGKDREQGGSSQQNDETYGGGRLEKAIERYGMSTVQSYLKFVRENAATSVRRLLGNLKDGEFEYELDSGEKIRASISVDHGKQEATIDYP